MFHVFNDQVFLESNIIRGMLICLAFPEQDVDAISGVQPCNISCVIYLVTGQERPCLSFFCIFFFWLSLSGWFCLTAQYHFPLGHFSLVCILHNSNSEGALK
jgi:hypothetical protein